MDTDQWIFDESFRDSDRATIAALQRLNERSLKASRKQRARERKMRESSDSEEGNSTVLTGQIKTPAENEPPKVAEKLDPALVGMSVGLKHLYSGKEDRRGRFQWQTTIPEDVGKPAEDAETQKWALIVRNVKVYNDPEKVLTIHSVVIQSPLLKQVLGKVLAGYPGVTVGLQRLEFSGKFEPLIHRFMELKSAIETLEKTLEAKGTVVDTTETQTIASRPKTVEEEGQEQVAKEDGQEQVAEIIEESDDKIKLKHTKLLYDLLVTEFQSLLDSSQDMKAKGVTTYEHLWTLFQPGSLIFCRVDGQDRVFKLSSAKYGVDRDNNPVFWLTLQYIDYDGIRFGTNKLNVSIRPFNGTRPITSLSSSPLDFHSNKAEMRAKLIDRGLKFEALAGSNFQAYEGMGWRTGNYGVKDKYSIKGRVVIDTYGWNRFNPNTAIYTSPLNARDLQLTNNDYPESEDEYDPNADYGYDDDDMEGGMPIDGHFAEEDEQTSLPPLDDDQRLICTPLVRGYALKEKLWLNFFVNSVRDIAFNSRAFDSLVLPESQKELILGFTASQQAYRNAFDDVVEGKGRGIILLLSGSPGVGKTLTAEAVSEEMHVPLYMMSAGELGLDSRLIENKLRDVFDMVTRWNAILLIDEADVFLEERSLHELERNKLVSIFLRVLEYYEGIMFLTTNRVQTFSAAFQSRIHISLEYPELSIDSRRQVWKNFLAHHDVVQASAREKPLKGSVSAIKNNLDHTSTNVASEAGGTQANGTTSVSEEVTEEAAVKKHQLATQPHAINDRQIDSLATMRMNGRQIKNVLKTAQLLASRRQEPLNKGHITTVLDVTQHLHNATRETERTRSSIFS